MRAYALIALLLTSVPRVGLADGLSVFPPPPEMQLITQNRDDIVRFEKRRKRLTIAGAVLIVVGVPVQIISASLLGISAGCGLSEKYDCLAVDARATIGLISAGSLMFIAGTILLGAADGDRKRARALRALPGINVSSTGASLSWGLKF